MCYDGLTLSAYVDGELDEIESSAIEYHLKSCAGCSGKVNRFTALHQQLEVSKQSESSFTSDIVWTRIIHSTAVERDLGFWHRGVNVSPALLFGLSFVFFAVIGLTFVLSRNNSIDFNVADNTNIVFPSDKFPLAISADSIETVLSYFNIHDETMEVSIHLSDPSNFAIHGEPRFLKKVDYVAGR